MFRLLLVLYHRILAIATLPRRPVPMNSPDPPAATACCPIRHAFRVGQMGGGGVSGTSPALRARSNSMPSSSAPRWISPSTPATFRPAIRVSAISSAPRRSSTPRSIRRSPSARPEVTRTGDMTARIEGRLSARGSHAPSVSTSPFDGRDGDVIRFRVTGKMSRALFGMEIGTPIYSNMFEFDMALVGRRS